ncbi:choice-of-anchor A family protein [Stigmatella aurantiaca]|uniref:Conserved repeat domain protein n=1 Tax=Stigmatella aurantiaca (strain DW4/3-1) TaxID=378806 RepID=Q08ZD5_STIAD|nr:choice-of-anchor A family protein [Stigmatella aurantiaca]ADO75346.1 uncharacterized protein STAUR_7591 [Stigmatella aurantiaca DW4/3-1]EAU65832.1 conserved repeat domain protein [Stigmatella aurantiaca DW4/3-1]
MPQKLGSVGLATLVVVAVTLLLSGCTAEPNATDNSHQKQTLSHIEVPLIANGGFEDGSLSGWTVNVYANRRGLRAVPPASFFDLNLDAAVGLDLTSAVGGAQGTQIPAGLSASSQLRYPYHGQWSAVINSLGKDYNTNSLSQVFHTTNADVDPADGKIHLRFTLALVFEDPGHSDVEQPYFYVSVWNVSRNKQMSSSFAYSRQGGVPWQTDPETRVLYTNWRAFDLTPADEDFTIGDQLELTIVSAGCSQGGHFGHVYVDNFGAFLPGPSIAASAPSHANAGSDLTYTYLVKNAGPDMATNVIVEQPLPAKTTFVAVNAPGASCTTPAAGAVGTVSCNLGTLNPNASTTFSLTVKIDPGETSFVSNGTYTVRSDTASPLLGPLVETAITQDMVFADLVLTKSDGLAAVTWGQPLQYVIEVTNRGPSAVAGARVIDTLPAQLTGLSWTCTAVDGGSCATPSGTGSIDAEVDLPVNAKAIFTLSAAVVSGSGSGILSNQASVTVPSGMADNHLHNNQSTDTDSIGELFQVTVNKAPGFQGTGSVVTSPAAITCDGACTHATAQFMAGTLVSVTATADPGSTFMGWTGVCTGTVNPCNFVITGDTVLTAQFALVKGPDGNTCSSPEECLSGSCVDGVCCESACTEQCMACNVPGLEGTCSPVTGAPSGGRPACASDGSVCGGSCDGTSGHCSYPGAAVECRQASCAANVEIQAAFCDGGGACPAPTAAACTQFVCGATACLTQCTTFEDCLTGHYCSPQGECLFDVDLPVLQLPAPIVLEGTSPAGAVAVFSATATDAISGSLPVTCTPASGTTFALGTATVTCGAQDGHGNVASGAFTVTVVDTTPPVLQLLGASDTTLECGTPYLEQGAAASDICSGDLTASIVTTAGVNSAAVGTYSVHYEVADGVGLTASADRVVTVQDTLAPVIHMKPGPDVLACSGTPYQDPGATAEDVCSGDLSSNIVVSSNLDQSREGQYTVSYTVKDPAGHTSTAVRHLSVGSCCLNVRLGDYNLFLLEDYTGGHDIVGKVAAGGNITLTNFAVGSGLPDNGIANTLVAGGNLTLSRGAVWGDAWYGGTYSADPSVVYPRGRPRKGTPIQFAARFADLRNLSSRLHHLPANGRTSLEPWGGVMLNGTNPSLNVFEMNASALAGAKLFHIHAPAGSMAVVNIRGTAVTLAQFSFTFSGGIDQRGVLYNFVDATHIHARSIGIQGTMLAPYAHVTFSDGSWDGGLYAVSLTGNAEGHINPLNDYDSCP